MSAFDSQSLFVASNRIDPASHFFGQAGIGRLRDVVNVGQHPDEHLPRRRRCEMFRLEGEILLFDQGLAFFEADASSPMECIS